MGWQAKIAAWTRIVKDFGSRLPPEDVFSQPETTTPRNALRG